MSEDDRFFITPPPGLLPPAPEPAEQQPVNTGSQTRRMSVPISAPPFRPMPRSPRAAPAMPLAPAAASSAVWTLVLADDSEREVTVDGVVVGRNPTAPVAWPRAQPVAIDDPERSVSKTHAVLVVDDGALRVLDLRSTNGVAVTVDGEQTRVSGAGVTIQTTAAVTLGQYSLTARRVDSAQA